VYIEYERITKGIGSLIEIAFPERTIITSEITEHIMMNLNIDPSIALSNHADI